MKERIKIFVLSILLGVVVSYAGFAGGNVDLGDTQKALTKASGELAPVLPFSSNFGLNWSDAYIGKQEPDVPLVYGAGLALGIISLPVGAMNDLWHELDVEGVDMDKYPFIPLPVYTAEGRLGGFSFPFDFGLKIGFLPSISPPILEGGYLNYLLVGGDLRYALLKGNGNLPKLSIGAGFNYFKAETGTDNDWNRYIYYSSSEYVTAHDSHMSTKFDVLTLDFKAQVSKSFSDVTPYFGLGLSHGWSNLGYSIDGRMSKSGDSPIGQNEIAAFRKYDVSLDSNGISSTVDNTGFSFRVFGGLSLDFRVIKIDLTGLYNIMDSNFGVSLGFRYQSPGKAQHPVNQQNISFNQANIATTQTNAVPVLSGYFVGINGQQMGPFDTAGLMQLINNGQLTRESLVWKEGMASWVYAATVAELAPLFL